MRMNSSATTSLLNEVVAAAKPPIGTTLYRFGSSCHGSDVADDVDVLLVYPDGHLDEAHVLAESIRSMRKEYVFDVLALSASEEHELAFVQSEQAARIWPPTT